MSKDTAQVIWLPVVDSTDTQFIAENDSAFRVTVTNGEDVHHIQSEHDGLVHFVSVDVPATAKVKVEQ
jgi:hypothetical protein